MQHDFALTSALFLLTNGAVLDKIAIALKGQSFEVLSTNLPKEKEAELRAAFGDSYSPAPALEEAGRQ